MANVAGLPAPVDLAHIAGTDSSSGPHGMQIMAILADSAKSVRSTDLSLPTKLISCQTPRDPLKPLDSRYPAKLQTKQTVQAPQGLPDLYGMRQSPQTPKIGESAVAAGVKTLPRTSDVLYQHTYVHLVLFLTSAESRVVCFLRCTLAFGTSNIKQT